MIHAIPDATKSVSSQKLLDFMQAVLLIILDRSDSHAKDYS